MRSLVDCRFCRAAWRYHCAKLRHLGAHRNSINNELGALEATEGPVPFVRADQDSIHAKRHRKCRTGRRRFSRVRSCAAWAYRLAWLSPVRCDTRHSTRETPH